MRFLSSPKGSMCPAGRGRSDDFSARRSWSCIRSPSSPRSPQAEAPASVTVRARLVGEVPGRQLPERPGDRRAPVAEHDRVPFVEGAGYCATAGDEHIRLAADDLLDVRLSDAHLAVRAV